MRRKLSKKSCLTKSLALTLALAVGVSMLPAQDIRAAEQDKEAAPREETTEEESHYERIDIGTAQEFATFAQNCYIDAWSRDKYVSLNADIDLSGVAFETIPVFNGTFDGAGHTISGFDYVGDGYVVGLFRYIESSGVVQNLTLKGNISSENEKECIGSICGINYGTVRNCTFQGTVSGRDTVGGIVGINENTGTLSNCSVNGRVTGYYSTGGIAGVNHGVINSCTNRAGINDDSAWVEEDDEMGGVDIIRNITSNEDNEIYSGVDTGGIAGLSDGVISRCNNAGIVGYEHTGYNIGGIAGRQSGVVSLSTNNGTVYGRKDIGGIVGQMEPFIEVNEAESIRDAIDKLHDLIEKTIDDMDAAADTVQGDVNALQAYADSALDTGDALAGQLSDFVDVNVDEVNTVSARMGHITDMIPDILNNVTASGNSMTKVNEAVKQLTEDLDILSKLEDSPYNETDYDRISLLSTVGGSLTSDSTEPEANATVTVTVVPDDGYQLKEGSLTVSDAGGKKVTVTPVSGRNDQYTFTMTKKNVKVCAEFVYKGTFLVKSTAGGRVTSSADGNNVTFRAVPSSGYSFAYYNVKGSRYTGEVSADNEIVLDKTAYITENSSVIVEAVFEKKNVSTHTISVKSGTGGTASVTSGSTAVVGDTVTIHFAAVSGYEYKQMLINGEDTSSPSTSNVNERTFTMPDCDVEVEVLFRNTCDVTSGNRIFPESNAGGDVRVKKGSDGSNYQITIRPQDGYDVAQSVALTFVPVETNGGAPGENAVPSSQVDRDGLVYDQEAGEYTYIADLSGDANSYRAIVSFVKKADSSADGSETHNITTVSSTGGAVAVDNTSAKAGERVYAAPAAENGYILSKILINGSREDLQLESDGKRYSFIMPDADVEITAAFEPVDVILKSNLSGNATYSGNAEGKVTINVKPDTAYAVKGITVTDAGGKKLSVSKKQSNSYLYEFDITTMEKAPCTIDITFTKQNKKQAVETYRTNISNAIDQLTKASDSAQKSIDKIRSIITKTDGSYKSWDELSSAEQDTVVAEVLNLADSLQDMSAAASTILSSLSAMYDILSPYTSDAAQAAKKDIETATEHMQSMLDALKAANNGVKGIVDYINAQPDAKFAQLGNEFDITRESLHNQLKGLSETVKKLSDDAGNYTDIINEDLRQVNDQINVVFNLLADRMADVEHLGDLELYEEVDDADIDSITTGKAHACNNKGIVKGDINVGGIAGSMAIDDEDLEDNAAGSVEYELGRRFITKCLIADSVNEGYVTAKKDGAGGICGYMDHGIITRSEAYGSVESTEGDFVGGICGESFTIIKGCYALCSVSGNQNVGGIAGYAETLKNCYAMADVQAENGRVGAIAGQIAAYEEVDTEASEEEPKVVQNYYVGDDVYGIDNISYIGVAEPISYADLLTVEQLPTPFWHLKVIYKIDDTYLGSEELVYGASLGKLNYPQIPEKEGCYGVWPDYSDKVMAGNLVIEGEYKENVTVVQSSERLDKITVEGREKPYALVEKTFTEDTVLNVSLSDMAPPAEIEGIRYVIYDISIENGGISEDEVFAVRLYNPYDSAVVWGYQNGTWTKLESKTRGQYLQADMQGTKEAFCIVETKSNRIRLIVAGAGTAALLILLIIFVKKYRQRRKKKKQQKKK